MCVNANKSRTRWLSINHMLHFTFNSTLTISEMLYFLVPYFTVDSVIFGFFCCHLKSETLGLLFNFLNK